jgi:hypothetical protein
MTLLDREAEKSAQHRTARREAYTAFVNAALAAIRDASMLRNESPFTNEDRWKDLSRVARNAYNSMAVAQGLVRIEGPTGSLTDAAEYLRVQVAEFTRVAQKATHPLLNDVTREKEAEKFQSASKAALKALSGFIETAQSTLEAG